MATVFRVTAIHADTFYARQAAAEALAELEGIENRLSRFVEGSDVRQINRLRPGEAALVTQDTFDCLRIALDVQSGTRGAFDVTYASAAATRHLPPSPLAGEGSGVRGQLGQITHLLLDGRLELDEASHRVRLLADGVRVDLGGIGKGFALDRMAAILREWDIESALLSASTSTHLALGPPPGQPGWPVRFGPDADPRHALLSGSALSASGKGEKGNHIIDPRTGRPAQRAFRAWAAAPTAAVADALSTAFMVMDQEEIRAFCREHPQVAAHVLQQESGPMYSVQSGA